MRAIVFFAIAVTVSGAGCGKKDTPQAVCEQLVSLREAAASEPASKSREDRMFTCIDRMSGAQEAMGQDEWASFAPCAVVAANVDALVACSPTMVQAADKTRRKRDAQIEKREGAIRDKIMDARKSGSK